MTLLMAVANPRLVERQVEWRAQRIDAGASAWDVKTLLTWRSLVRPYEGDLARMEDLASRVQVIEGVVDEAQATSLAKWERACREAWADFKLMARDLAAEAQEENDRQQSIAPILENGNPMLHVTGMLLAMERGRARFERGSHGWAAATRDSFYVAVQQQCAFRLGTVRRLEESDLDPAAGFLFTVDRRKFKNWRSKFFREGKRWVPFRRPLADVDGRIHAILKDYLDVARPILLAGRACEALFIGDGGERMRPAAIENMCERISGRHLAERPESGGGIRGVRKFRNHAFRDVLATSTLKAGGEDPRQNAADAIADTLASVDRYIRWLPRQREQRLHKTIAMVASTSHRPVRVGPPNGGGRGGSDSRSSTRRPVAAQTSAQREYRNG